LFSLLFSFGGVCGLRNREGTKRYENSSSSAPFGINFGVKSPKIEKFRRIFLPRTPFMENTQRISIFGASFFDVANRRGGRVMR
jgi:hypothetical protein